MCAAQPDDWRSGTDVSGRYAVELLSDDVLTQVKWKYAKLVQRIRYLWIWLCIVCILDL